MDDYQPIPCADHERLEFAVLRRQRLLIAYRDGAEVVDAHGLPTDVETREGAEWLTFRDDQGTITRLRLDRLIRFGPA